MNLPTRVTLLERLKNLEDDQSWREFFAIYWKLIYQAATRAGLSDAEAQDVVQETVIAVAKKMPGFRYTPGKDSFKGWLLQITRWKIADQFRKRSPAKPPSGEHRTAAIERVPDPASLVREAFWEEEWKKNLAKAAMKRIRKQVPARDYEAFLLYVVEELPAQKAAEKCGIGVDEVYRIKHRVSALLKKEITRLESAVI